MCSGRSRGREIHVRRGNTSFHPLTPAYSKVLSSKNFDQEIASPEVGTLVAFFGEWRVPTADCCLMSLQHPVCFLRVLSLLLCSAGCGHCKSLEPTWTKVAKTFQTDSKVGLSMSPHAC
jgi:hypothetical protein